MYAAQLVSFAGDWVATVPVLGLCLQVIGSTAVASLVLVLQTGALFLVSPFAGMLADRLDRRRLLIVASLGGVVTALLGRDAAFLMDALSLRSPRGSSGVSPAPSGKRAPQGRPTRLPRSAGRTARRRRGDARSGAAVTLTATVSTLVAGGLAATFGPVVTLYVMMALVALSGGTWLLWTRPLRRAPSAPSGAVPQAASPPRTLDP